MEHHLYGTSPFFTQGLPLAQQSLQWFQFSKEFLISCIFIFRNKKCRNLAQKYNIFSSFQEEVIDFLQKYLKFSPFFMVDKIRAFVARWYLLHTKMRFCIFFAEFWLLEALQERSERWSTTSVTSISSPPSPPLPTPPPLAMSPWTGYRKAYEKVQQIKNSPEFGPSDM